LFSPTDHLPQARSDRDLARGNAEIERRKGLFRQARNTAQAIRTLTDRQPAGSLTRAEAAILSEMVLQNLRACVRRDLSYRPTRKRLAKATGYSERTVSTAIARLKDAGVVVVARYAKGGRLGDKGRGLATEFRAGCLQFLADQLAGLGYRLPKSLRADLVDLGAWAAAQVGEHTAPASDAPARAKPTGKKLPGTLYPSDRAAPKGRTEAPVAVVGFAENGPRPVGSGIARRSAPPPAARTGHLPSTAQRVHQRNVGLERPDLGRLAGMALAAAGMVPMPPNRVREGVAERAVPFSLPSCGGMK